jgi:hypothetical protein
MTRSLAPDPQIDGIGLLDGRFWISHGFKVSDSVRRCHGNPRRLGNHADMRYFCVSLPPAHGPTATCTSPEHPRNPPKTPPAGGLRATWAFGMDF